MGTGDETSELEAEDRTRELWAGCALSVVYSLILGALPHVPSLKIKKNFKRFLALPKSVYPNSWLSTNAICLEGVGR